jgi:uncharacterized membrane protein
MDKFELSIVINRPAEEVFEHLANLENDLQWRREWVDARKTSDGSIAVGSTIRLTGEMLGRKIPTVYEVIEYVPDRIAAWKAVSGPFPLAFRRMFERVDGGTRVTIRYDISEVRGFSRLVLSLLAGSVKRQHEGDLRRVKELIEARA